MHIVVQEEIKNPTVLFNSNSKLINTKIGYNPQVMSNPKSNNRPKTKQINAPDQIIITHGIQH